MSHILLVSGLAIAMIIPTSAQSLASSQKSSGYLGDNWLLTYRGKSSNEVRWDPRLQELLNKGLPRIYTSFYDPHKLLPDVALIALSGPPQPVGVESGRFVTVAASVPQVGELKGFLWVDTDASGPKLIFAALDQNAGKTSQASLALFTRSDNLAAKLPPQFVSSLSAWLSSQGISKITQLTMTNSEDKTSQLPIAILGF